MREGSEPTILDKLLTPEEIARRITASSGVNMTARTVWEKAKRLGIAKKIGRSVLISIDDVPKLLQQEKEKPRSVSTKMALAMLRRKRKEQKARQE